MTPIYFKTQSEFRRWLSRNHEKAGELWLGFYKKNSGKRGITYQEALDEALCFGWIDGIVKRVDDLSYMHRFTPRTKKSIWSRINIARIAELKKLGLMAAPGLKAFETRDPSRSGLYSFENPKAALSAADEKTFRANAQAWTNFQALPPSYRRPAIWWVVSAKKEETRIRRLQKLIADSARNQRLAHLTSPSRKSSNSPKI